jgi:23S rRNA (cytosine1962-C5)-methyltransferase
MVMDLTDDVKVTRYLSEAVNARQSLIDADHVTAFRMFNGFYEGIPDLVADVYGKTLVLVGYGADIDPVQLLLQQARDFYLESLPWITCVINKYRAVEAPELCRGTITFGSKPETEIMEHGCKYALDLLMNQDNSLYLDTRNLRKWLLEQSVGVEVLNTFAYTGSLGVAALAGGASQVTQVDRNQRFLDVARRSAVLNHLDLGKMRVTAVDFFVEVGQLKRKGRLFDLVILDPPFFSVTGKGTVDQVENSTRLINKIRPLVKDGGRIIAINNALFLSGEDYMKSLKTLDQNGFLQIQEIIPVPSDITGYPETVRGNPPVNPSPFNHATKIAVLSVKQK